MTSLDQQLMVKDEVTYATAVTVDRSFEIDSDGMTDAYGRTEGDPMRPGTFFKRSDRFTPYYAGGAGTFEMAVLTKGFGWWLKHLLGTSATTGPAETTVYTHTGTAGPLVGDFFTCQIVRPFHPSGTAQALTYAGCKVPKWSLANAVDGNLMLSVDVDACKVATATAVATFAPPAGMENLTWAGGVVTVGGSSFDVTEFSMECDNGLDVDRRQIRGSTDKKEPTGDGKTGSFSVTADFADLTARARAASLTAAGAVSQIIGTWTGPTLLGSTLFPRLVVTIPAPRFDTWEAPNAARGVGVMQSLSGDIRFDGTNSGITLAYSSADAVA